MANCRITMLLGPLIVFLAGCSLPNRLPASPVTSASIQDAIASGVAQTAIMASTQAASFITPTETATLMPHPTWTPTVPVTVTRTPFLSASAGELDCKVISQSIKNGTRFNPNERFDMGWKVRNTGTITWDPANTDFVYTGGTKMFQAERFDLLEAVAQGDTTALSASLRSPKKPGTYYTVWALRRGFNRFCRVSLEIIVP